MRWPVLSLALPFQSEAPVVSVNFCHSRCRAATTRTQAMTLAEAMATRWEPTQASMARLLEEAVEDCLTCLAFPLTHRAGLPPGDTIVASAPPESLIGQHPPPAPQPSGAAPGIGFDANGNRVTPVAPAGSPIAPPPAALQTAEVKAVATRTGGNDSTLTVPTPTR